MMIKLSPQRRDDRIEISKLGKSLIINGEVFDFSPMNDGDTLPRSAISSIWFAGDVEMEAGEVTLTILLPLPANYSQEQAFPVDLVDVKDGVVELPLPLEIVYSEFSIDEEEPTE